MPKRTVWLTAGIALGAGSSLWVERRVRRTIEQTAARLAPEALVSEVGRTARHVAESTSHRFRDAYSEGRDEMRRQEEQLWSDLAKRGVVLSGDGSPEIAGPTGATNGSPFPPAESDDTTRATRRRIAKRSAKSPSHLGN
jgi:hypothetical protein